MVKYKEYYIIVRHVLYSQFYLDVIATSTTKKSAEIIVKRHGGEAVHHTEFKNLTRWCA